MQASPPPPSLDVRQAAARALQLQGTWPLTALPRLVEGMPERMLQGQVQWSLRAWEQTDAAGHVTPWLELSGRAEVPTICQRCLEPAWVAVAFDQRYRFVASESQAEAEDEESEEDVMVLTRSLDVATLLEDEFIMAVPLVPMHPTCPVPLPQTAQDPDFEDAASRPQPFAALAALRKGDGQAGGAG